MKRIHGVTPHHADTTSILHQQPAQHCSTRISPSSSTCMQFSKDKGVSTRKWRLILIYADQNKISHDWAVGNASNLGNITSPSKVEDHVITPACLTPASNSNKEDDNKESSSESLPLMRLPGSTGGRIKKESTKESKVPASSSPRILSKPRHHPPLSAYNFFLPRNVINF
eukprot:scaffold28493_cov59-Attheya_sp.AAC.2